MISLEVSLKHMAWSNQLFLAAFDGMPTSVYELKAADGEWSVGRLLMHLLDSAEWYRYCLDGGELREFGLINSDEKIQVALTVIASLDESLLNNVFRDDEILEVKEGETVFHASRSLILSQAVMHTAEHKGQIATILKQHGIHLELDGLDVWSFVARTSGLDRNL